MTSLAENTDGHLAIDRYKKLRSPLSRRFCLVHHSDDKEVDSAVTAQAEFSSVQIRGVRVVRKIGGVSGNLLVRDSKSRLWVLKFNPAPETSNVLVNEFIGAKLMAALAIPVPEHTLFRVDSLSTQKAANASHVPHRIIEGLCFASRYQPCLNRAQMIEHLPSPLELFVRYDQSFADVFAFDTWAMHADRRQALYLVNSSHLEATFIDNGHLFGGPQWRVVPKRDFGQVERLALRHKTIRTDLQRSVDMIQRIVPKALDDAFKQLPVGWPIGDSNALLQILWHRLSILKSLVSFEFEQATEACLKGNRLRCDVSGGMNTLYSSGNSHWSNQRPPPLARDVYA